MENCEQKRSCTSDEFDVFTFEHKWTIKNFNFCVNVLKSCTFSSSLTEVGDKWHLEADPKYKSSYDCYSGQTSRKQDYLAVVLELDSINTNFLGNYSISIIRNGENKNKKKEDLVARSAVPVRLAVGPICTWDQLIARSDLLEPSNGYLIDDSIQILCEIKIKIGDKKNAGRCYNIIEIENEPQLRKSMRQLLSSGKSTDVVFKVGAKSFPAIKGIISTRSPVFEAMFEHEDMKENKNNEVIVEDIDEDVFEELLHYIYTNETLKIEEMPSALLAAADKYQLNYLKNCCEKILAQNLTVENASELFLFSDRHSATQLREKSLELIREKLQYVALTEGFKVLVNSPGNFIDEIRDKK